MFVCGKVPPEKDREGERETHVAHVSCTQKKWIKQKHTQQERKWPPEAQRVRVPKDPRIALHRINFWRDPPNRPKIRVHSTPTIAAHPYLALPCGALFCCTVTSPRWTATNVPTLIVPCRAILPVTVQHNRNICTLPCLGLPWLALPSVASP